MAGLESYENDLNLEATELTLSLPGRNGTILKALKCKRTSVEMQEDYTGSTTDRSSVSEDCPPPSKAQIVGWPPVRSYMKNNLQPRKTHQNNDGVYVKVSMDGAPYLRKIDLNLYRCYPDLLAGLDSMFQVRMGTYSERDGYCGSEFVPTYEDKDSDWMLVGDVPWQMFVSCCKKLRIMKSSEAKGLGCL